VSDPSQVTYAGDEAGSGNRIARRHRLPLRDLDALLAGLGGEHTVRLLGAGEESWRLLALSALALSVADGVHDMTPLPPLESAWQLLDRAESRAPAQVRATIRYPQVGIWVAYILRRLRGCAAGDSPLWVDLGYLHAVAAVAGIRAGLDFRIRIPVRNGTAVLPTLGHAVFPSRSPWESAEVQCESGTVRIRCGDAVVDVLRPDASDGPEQLGPAVWYGLHRLRSEAAGTVLQIVLDDADPYRSLREPTLPNRLPEHSAHRWQAYLDEAWDLLVRVDRERAEAIAAGLVSLTPLPPAEPFRPLSASADDAFGTALVSEPENPAQLAVGLLHEFQHNKLGSLMHQIDMYDRGTRGLFYAPWRDDPRPLGGVLQGIYAFVAIAGFYGAYRHLAGGAEADLAHFEFALWRQQIHRALRQLRGRPELTAFGDRLVESLAGEVAALLAEDVPAPWQAAADLAAGDHWARWRIHHLVPDPDTVHRLATAWRAGAACPPYVDGGAQRLRDDPAGRWIDARAVLFRLRLTDAAAFATLSGESGYGVSGAEAADVVYTSGDIHTAQAMYLERLAAVPDDPWAWTGLRLTLAGDPATPVTGALQTRPEIVRAVQVVLADAGTPAPPLDLVAWLGTGGSER
jgi:HEXXH motif-containing protein